MDRTPERILSTLKGWYIDTLLRQQQMVLVQDRRKQEGAKTKLRLTAHIVETVQHCGIADSDAAAAAEALGQCYFCDLVMYFQRWPQAR